LLAGTAAVVFQPGEVVGQLAGQRSDAEVVHQHFRERTVRESHPSPGIVPEAVFLTPPERQEETNRQDAKGAKKDRIKKQGK
jgi:hypothetical protein